MEFSRQESWSGLPFPSPGDLPDSGIKPTSPALAGRLFRATRKPFIPSVCNSLQAFSVLPNVDNFNFVLQTVFQLGWFDGFVLTWFMLNNFYRKKNDDIVSFSAFHSGGIWWSFVPSLVKLTFVPDEASPDPSIVKHHFLLYNQW